MSFSMSLLSSTSFPASKIDPGLQVGIIGRVLFKSEGNAYSSSHAMQEERRIEPSESEVGIFLPFLISYINLSQGLLETKSAGMFKLVIDLQNCIAHSNI